MADNSILSTKFYLTARAGEQLNSTKQNKTEEKPATPAFENYVSTTSKEENVSKSENDAIKYNAIANFTLGKNSSLNAYNNYVKSIEMNKKFA